MLCNAHSTIAALKLWTYQKIGQADQDEYYSEGKH